MRRWDMFPQREFIELEVLGLEMAQAARLDVAEKFEEFDIVLTIPTGMSIKILRDNPPIGGRTQGLACVEVEYYFGEEQVVFLCTIERVDKPISAFIPQRINVQLGSTQHEVAVARSDNNILCPLVGEYI